MFTVYPLATMPPDFQYSTSQRFNTILFPLPAPMPYMPVQISALVPSMARSCKVTVVLLLVGLMSMASLVKAAGSTLMVTLVLARADCNVTDLVMPMFFRPVETVRIPRLVGKVMITAPLPGLHSLTVVPVFRA